MTVLRIYDPEECDAQGVPLDWEQCRACGGTGYRAGGEGVTVTYQRRIALLGSMHMTGEYPCLACDGHGSLKAAALFGRLEVLFSHGPVRFPSPAADKMRAECGRCEDCGHPMSDGTWEKHQRTASELRPAEELRVAERRLREGREPLGMMGVHYSRCDERCRHLNDEANGLLRVRRHLHPSGKWSHWITTTGSSRRTAGEIVESGRDEQYEASWRQVDVRTLGWPHDLRPEKLAVLCLRCWAERIKPVR